MHAHYRGVCVCATKRKRACAVGTAPGLPAPLSCIIHFFFTFTRRPRLIRWTRAGQSEALPLVQSGQTDTTRTGAASAAVRRVPAVPRADPRTTHLKMSERSNTGTGHEHRHGDRGRTQTRGQGTKRKHGDRARNANTGTGHETQTRGQGTNRDTGTGEGRCACVCVCVCVGGVAVSVCNAATGVSKADDGPLVNQM